MGDAMLGTVIIGYSIAFGSSTIRWADVRFAHRFAGGAAPDVQDRYGMARAIKEWKIFGLAVLAWLVSCALLVAAIALVGEGDPTELRSWIPRLSVVLGIWFVIALSYTVFPKRGPSLVDPVDGEAEG